MSTRRNSIGWRLYSASRVFALSTLISATGIGVELVVFTVASSIILLTDLFHWAVDTVLEVVFLLTLMFTSRTRKRFPWSTVIIESSLTTFSCLIILGVYFYMFVDYLFNAYESVNISTQSYTPLVATITGGFLTLLTYIILKKSYKQYKVELLRVDSIHALVDVIAAVVASLGVILTVYTKNMAVEIFFTFILMLFVFHSLVEVFRNNIKAIMGGELNAELSLELKKKLEENINKNINIANIEARKLGSFYVVNIELEVDPDTTILEIHRLRRKVIKAITEKCDLVYHVDIRFNPKHTWRKRYLRKQYS